jgi:hypothetical protein
VDQIQYEIDDLIVMQMMYASLTVSWRLLMKWKLESSIS